MGYWRIVDFTCVRCHGSGKTIVSLDEDVPRLCGTCQEELRVFAARAMGEE